MDNSIKLFVPFEEICLNCSAKIITYTGLHARVVNCNACNKEHIRTVSGNLNLTKTEKNKLGNKKHLRPILPLHTKFKYRDLEWMVVGIIQKEEKNFTTWFEYAVYSPKVGIGYMSQVQFHFTWHSFNYGYDSIMLSKNIIEFSGLEYRKFHKYSCKVRRCWGEWPNLLNIEEYYIFTEYVAPPSSITVIQSNDEHTILKGTYISWKDLQKMFPEIMYIPKPIGIGSNQPIFMQNESSKYWSLMAISVLLLCAIQLIITFLHPSETLVYQSLINVKNKEEFVSPEFEIKGRKGLVEVSVSADISNTWIYYDTFIVNENTGEQFGFSEETELYSGYTDGESWVEGNRTLEKKLTGVPAGTYRLVIRPEFSNKDISTNVNLLDLLTEKETEQMHILDISIYRLHYSMVNFWIIFLFILIPYIIITYYRHSREKSRWMNSNYYSDYYEEN